MSVCRVCGHQVTFSQMVWFNNCWYCRRCVKLVSSGPGGSK